jgi:hypothetical protein
MANRKYTSQFLYSFEAMPVLLSCSFVVASADAGGLGITSLEGEGLSRVYMHTSATPAAGNPNPASGIIQVNLSDSYSRLLNLDAAVIQPLLGSPTTSTTANVVNVISVLGTATLAQWQARGLPVGVVPAVGVSFIASATGVIGGSATVDLLATAGSNITNIELVPNTRLNVSARVPLIDRQAAGSQAGGYVLLRCMKNSALTAPADGSIIKLSFLLSNSSVTVKGQ